MMSKEKQRLIKKLDKVFSLYIRKRDSDDGAFYCCSCRQWKPDDQADAGHYINRSHMATRWREDNVHSQCRKCNRFEEGNAAGYTIFMLQRYGYPRIELLAAMSRETANWSESDLELMIKDYQKRYLLL